MISRDEGVNLFSPLEVIIHLIKIACERPDRIGRSLSQWDCSELARELQRCGIVTSISAETVRRILYSQKLKPWRYHLWLNSNTPRNEEFCRKVEELIYLYTQPTTANAVVLCVDEKTSLQPRPRKHPTKPCRPGSPNLVEHEYKRDGALNLFAAFDVSTGRVYGQCYERKRQEEFIAFLEYLDSQIPAEITVHIVCDNVSVHKGKKVRQWLDKNPRFVFHFTPVHCSWMNQVEQWFSILQRKRFKIADFESKSDFQEKIVQFIQEWNEHAHPFKWSSNSMEKVVTKVRLSLTATKAA